MKTNVGLSLVIVIFLGSLNSFAEETTGASKRNPKECLTQIRDYYPYSFKPDPTWVPKNYTSGKLIGDATALRHKVCEQMFMQEVEFLRRNPGASPSDNCVVTSLSELNQGGKPRDHELIKACRSSLTHMDIIEQNPKFKELFALVTKVEADNAQAKQTAEANNQAVLKVERFEVKGLHLGKTQADLIQAGGAQKIWKCGPSNDVTGHDICKANLYTTKTTVCDKQSLYNPVTDQYFMADTNCRTTFQYIPQEKLPPGIKDASTITGHNVSSITAKFFNGVMYSLEFDVFQAPELFDAITQKYGKHNGPPRQNGISWIGSSEELRIGVKTGLQIFNQKVYGDMQAYIKSVRDQKELEKRAKNQLESEKKMKDF